jgi:hypothetical protein
VHRQFKYYRITSPRVAAMMESITVVAAIDCPPRYQPKSAKDAVLGAARICYDHFAGRFGVALSDALVARDFINSPILAARSRHLAWRSFAIRTSTWTRMDQSACSAARVSIGANGDIMLPVSLAPACAGVHSSADGWRASRARVQ